MTVSIPLSALVDFVIALTLIEGVLLVLYHLATGRGIAPREFVANLVSGLFLMLALRCAVRESGAAWIALSLLAAGSAHGTDIWLRWRRDARHQRTSREVAA